MERFSMSKELSPLEAFQKLKGYIPLDWEETKLVEKTLKESAKNKLFINEILDMLSNDNNINDVLNDIKDSDSYEDFASIYSSCPKEKYDLIREVLL